MLPALRSPSQARVRRLPPFRLTASLVGLALALQACPALAQDVGEELNPTGSPSNLDQPRPSPAPSQPKRNGAAASAAADGPVAFEADTVQYDQNSDTVTATGNVVLRRQNQSARGDKMTWNQTTGKIIATGNVRLVDQNGNQLFTDSRRTDRRSSRPGRCRTCCSLCARAGGSPRHRARAATTAR